MNTYAKDNNLSGIKKIASKHKSQMRKVLTLGSLDSGKLMALASGDIEKYFIHIQQPYSRGAVVRTCGHEDSTLNGLVCTITSKRIITKSGEIIYKGIIQGSEVPIDLAIQNIFRKQVIHGVQSMGDGGDLPTFDINDIFWLKRAADFLREQCIRANLNVGQACGVRFFVLWIKIIIMIARGLCSVVWPLIFYTVCGNCCVWGVLLKEHYSTANLC